MTDSKEPELKCPCCGTDAVLLEHPRRGSSLFRVKCLNSECGLQTSQFSTREKAIAAWNTRPAPAITDQAVRDMVERLRRIRGTQLTPYENALMGDAADMLASVQAQVEGLEKFNAELRRYIYDKTPERREKVCERFMPKPPTKKGD